MNRKYLFWLVLIGLAFWARTLHGQTSAAWPNYNSAKWLHVAREAGTNTCAVAEVGFALNQCARQCDLLSAGSSCLLRLHYSSKDASHLDPATAGVNAMYYVHGVPVSGWIAPPFTFTLSIDNQALANVQDGVHDISIDVQSVVANRGDFHYVPMLLHLKRGGLVSPLVPLLSQDNMYADFADTAYGGEFSQGPRVVYVDPVSRNLVGHPITDTTVTPWHTPPQLSDLYQVEMAPHTNLFMAAQLWWQFPAQDPDAGKIYARAMVPKYDEDHPGLRTIWHHDRFPFIDGPRGVAWSSPYVTGQVNSQGVFYFVETGGVLRTLKPDGSMNTLAGWRVKRDKFPIFPEYSRGTVWQNEDLVGNWIEGQWPDRSGFRTPLDVALDPKNEKEMYVASYEDNVIWKVVERDAAPADISVFAGDVGHASGWVDSDGHNARFNGPTSVVFDPLCDCLYVADQNNDAIRKITRAGQVTTLAGSPGAGSRIAAACNCDPGQPQYSAATRNRQFAQFTVSAAEAAQGKKPEVFTPMTVRVDSKGFVLFVDYGFGAIRRVNPSTLETTAFAELQPGHWDNASQRGWMWFEVDRWGNAGEKDGVYSCVFQQASLPSGETVPHPNEYYAYTSPHNGAGGQSFYIFPDQDSNPDGWGPRDHSDPPHYCWNVAVDPRGGVYLAGGGEHGQTYLRARKPTDVAPTDYNAYYRSKILWKSGGDGQFGSTFGPSFMLKFGSEAHNYLGFPDAWDVTSATTDAQLASMFEVPAAWTGTDRSTLFAFVRVNAGVGPAVTPPTPDPGPTPPPAGSGIWSRQGSDAGMTKYTSSDIPATSPTLAYTKRFYSTWTGYTGNYFFANNLVVNAGSAVLFANDAPENVLKATKFDWQTGATVVKWAQPYSAGQHDREADSHHFTNPITWHTDGQIYNRRGGDSRDQYALDPSTGTWRQIGIYQPPDTAAWGGDATAYLQVYGNQIFDRWGHVDADGPYAAFDKTSGAWIQSLGPNVAGDRFRYGDWPKIGQNVHVIAASVGGGTQLYLEARALAPSGGILWSKTLASDAGGLRGTHSGIADYWRFIATEDGNYVFFTRSGAPTVHVLNIQTGVEKCSKALGNASERPLLGAHGGALYVIGRAEQLKLDIDTCAQVWRQTGSYPGDAGYLHENFEDTSNLSTDIVYRPMVLTDSSLWFVDGDQPNAAKLVGLSTSTGAVVGTVDLAAQARTGTLSLDLVNDMAAADGLLGVLVTLKDLSDSHPPQNPYQELYVYSFGQAPPPPTDSDGDGVPDTIDQCPGTLPGTPVDAVGCPLPPPPPLDTVPPSITPNVPATGTVGVPLTISATATDNVGVTAGTVTLPGGAPQPISYPYSTSWTPPVAGTAIVTFTASDAAGNVATSNSSIAVADPNIPPPPVPTMTVTPATSGNSGQYTFTAQLSQPLGGVNVTFILAFPDGRQRTLQAITNGSGTAIVQTRLKGQPHGLYTVQAISLVNGANVTAMNTFTF